MNILILGVFIVAVSSLTGQAFLYEPNCDGKQVMVHLFEWKWTDIAAECERYLGPNHFCGVQVSPPSEHTILPNDIYSTEPYPWWQRYQPISYKLESRSGTEFQFIDMVHRCNKVGVRIYVDAVINHMAGKGRNGTGDAGSHYDSDELDFPGVPFSSQHFTPCELCPSDDCNVSDNQDPANMRNCWVLLLADLYGASEYVRDKIAAYLNRLTEIGVAGIRIDAAKHMWPEDIAAILSKLNDLPIDQGFQPGSKMFVYQEVIDLNDEAIKVTEYYDSGYVTEFRYCYQIARGIANYSHLNNLIDYDWGMARSDRAFIFVDNHDNQRGHGASDDILTYKSVREYKQAVAYTLAQDYGFTRIMSSYDFVNGDQGPPPRNGSYITGDVSINSDGSCGGGWICEHRWNVMKKMVQFRNSVNRTTMSHYWNNGRAVAFARSGQGFFAMAKDGFMDENLQTGLPKGSYCNIIDDCATSIQVASDGLARVVISSNNDEPILAVCVGCYEGNGPNNKATSMSFSNNHVTLLAIFIVFTKCSHFP